jgi:Phage integrase family
LDESRVRKVLLLSLKRAGLPRFRVRDLRHTFASLLIQNGKSLAYVRDQMGHASIQIPVDTYGHLVPGGNRDAVDRLDDAPGGVANPSGSKVVATGRSALAAAASPDLEPLDCAEETEDGPPRDRTEDPLIKRPLKVRSK